MAQSYVQVPVDGAGKKIDAWVTAVAAQYRQSIVIGDPDTDANVVAISSRLKLPVELEQLFDFDTGAGTATGSGIGIMLPANGGPTIAGIVDNPLFVRLSDGTNPIATLPISAASLPLPTGAATEATLGDVETVLGATTGAKVITDANGSIQQYLRGLIYLLITAGSKSTSYEKAIYGTAQTVINSAVDIANGDFSGAPAATFDNTNDTVVPYARYAKVMAEFPDWAAAPTALSQIDLYGVLQDTDGTEDDTDAPSGTSSGGARYFGSFTLAATDALQRRTIYISLEGVEKVNFYLRNGSGQNMNNDGGTNCVVKVTPIAYAMTG